MSADRSQQSRAKPRPRETIPGTTAFKSPMGKESSLVNLYRNITQENESQAKNVLMFVIRDEEKSNVHGPN
jgi:hypothetical protein